MVGLMGGQGEEDGGGVAWNSSCLAGSVAGGRVGAGGGTAAAEEGGAAVLEEEEEGDEEHEEVVSWDGSEEEVVAVDGRLVAHEVAWAEEEEGGEGDCNPPNNCHSCHKVICWVHTYLKTMKVIPDFRSQINNETHTFMCGQTFTFKQ